MTALQQVQQAMADAINSLGASCPVTGLGNCYQTALHTFAAVAPFVKSVKLCHGFASYDDSPAPVGHGWVQVGDYVVDVEGTYTLQEWKQLRRPSGVNIYGEREVRRLAKKSGHSGPWDKRLM